MKPTIRNMNVQVTGKNQKTTSGEVYLQEWDKSARMKRALKVGLGSIVLAGFAVFIPIVHFILVPALLLGGPIAAYYIYRLEQMVKGGKSTCPECGKPFEIAQGLAKWPLSDICGSCRSPVTINLLA